MEITKLMPAGTDSLSGFDKTSNTTGKSFGEFLSDALDQVNGLQKQADQASVDLAAGKVEDVSQAVIAMEKATLAFQLTMQVRNKVIDAYQEVMRMQV